MKCSVFIATSVDGYIADRDGGVDWLQSAGNADADMQDDADMGFLEFMSTIDCLIMGRGCMEALAGFNLSPEQWPYGTARVIVLSKTLRQPPDNLRGRVEMFSGDVQDLMSSLAREGYTHAYVDGGKTIQSFLELKLIDQLILTRAPILLGDGIPLFGKASRAIRLKAASAKTFPNDFIQLTYKVSYE